METGTNHYRISFEIAADSEKERCRLGSMTNSQSEQVIHILEDMLRCCIIEFKGSWEKFLPLVDFAYNNRYQTSIKMAPYKALYPNKCRTPLYWSELSERKIIGVTPLTHIRCQNKVKEYYRSLQNNYR
ncbi:Retrotransposon protein, Ty3-gypsy subclass [Gossypium australe]|uniref:Retrotransposon protein, Ty3-gypsy subclass n=1 Tax=Gossypium australe TaxID=47621 RepID=A0A5B6W7B6_9ROSI|nr:Retrotransposon protein, Ty3-gypsy subclass [Gossypium australe]